MGPASVVMGCPLFDKHLQMAFVDRDQEVEALAAQASAQPFTDGVCPGRPNGSSKNSHSEARHFLVQPPGEDGSREFVSVQNQRVPPIAKEG